jgi:thioredoxin-related protein
MKKLLVLLFLFAATLFASDLHVEKNFKEMMINADLKNRPIMFIISRHTCKYCIMLEKQTLSKPEIIKRLNKEFITYIAYIDDGDMFSQDYWRPGTPSIWFLDDKGAPLGDPLMGMVEEKNMLEIFDEVQKRFNKRKKSSQYDYMKNNL